MREENHRPPTSLSLQHEFMELRERARKDALSGLLNRVTAESYINKRLREVGPDDLCALFIIDLDNFKQVNDSLGHLAGDTAIRQSGRILSGLFRATDIVGRLGGDEFIAFISGSISEGLIRCKGRLICERLQIVLSGNPSITLTASAGIYVSRGGNSNFDELYQAADLALYRAKKGGKHSYCVRHGKGLLGHGVDEDEDDGYLPVSAIPLSGLLEHLDSGVALLEMGDLPRLIYVSPSFCRIIGADPESFPLPCPLSSFVHPDDLVDLERALRVGLESNETVDHTHRVSADAEGGSWLWWHTRASRTDYSGRAPVMLVTSTDVSSFKESEQRLQESNERLQSAFDQTAQGMWEVDIATETFSLYSRIDEDHLSSTVQERFPDALISNGFVHPSSTARFREFAQELLAGKSQGYGNFVVQHQDTGCYGWTALSYRRICDDAGRAIKAVGIIERLPQEYAGQPLAQTSKLFFPKALIPYLIVAMRANLSEDVIEELWVEGKDLSGQAADESCSSMLKEGARHLFSHDDRLALADYFDRERLIELFESGERWLSVEYRRVDGCGSISTVSHFVNLMRDPLTQDVRMSAYISQADPQHDREMALGIDLVHDPVTGLYDRATTRAFVELQLGKLPLRECALAILQVGGLERLCAENGAKMNRLRHDLAVALSVALGPSCVIGQYSRDKLLVFFQEIRSREEARQQLEEASTFVRLALADAPFLDSLRLVAGLATARQNRTSYTSLVSQALRLCQLWRNAAADSVALSEDNDDWSWSELQHSGGDQVVIGDEELGRPLSEGEKDVALQCVSSMLSSDSLDTSVRSVLSYIGTYYRADRVYVLTLTEDQGYVTMPYEWTSTRKPSIQQAASGLLIDRLPILRRCMEERAPVFLTRMLPLEQPSSPGEESRWHFTTFPLIEDDAIMGFLCIENPREHPTDAALFTTLIPYILGEQKRFHTKMSVAGDPSGVYPSDLPNLRSYMNVIYSINSDVYSSMGAVCLDIPGLSSINGSQGFKYGSRMLWYVSKTLTDIFGHSLIFRTWDAEFVALCPDTTQRVFLGRCNRLRSALERRYPNDLRIGYSWSEGIFSGKALVSEARSIMRCAQVRDLPEAGSSSAGPTLPATGGAGLVGRFTIHLQPKVNMVTGDLIGAEALVRGIDADGSLVYPSRFIKQLEKAGSVRDIDLFVLDRTLALMDDWRERGMTPVPISVNISRSTLFDPTALASVMAIQSRYPLLPPDLLELEVTERGIRVDSRSLSETMDRFRELGVRFALDDFGSEYANITIFTNVKFDCVKLDRSLIAELASNPRARMLVNDLVKICHTCDMFCVAEGVETKAQIAALADAGCVCGQGFYFDRALPVEQFEDKYLRPIP